jgi:hypothetical protein
MKNCNLVTYLLLASVVTTFSNSVAVRADTLGKSHLIAQSRRQYECSRNGVQPSISGAIFENGYCFIPISSGKCMFYKNQYTESYSPNTNGWLKCYDQPTMTDPTTGKKYYKFSVLDTFVLN